MMKHILSVIFVIALVNISYAQQPDPATILQQSLSIEAKDLISNQAFLQEQKSREAAALAEAKIRLAAAEQGEKETQEKLANLSKVIGDLKRLEIEANDISAQTAATAALTTGANNLATAKAATPQVPADIQKAEQEIEAAKNASNTAFFQMQTAKQSLEALAKKLKEAGNLPSDVPSEVIKTLESAQNEQVTALAKLQKETGDARIAIQAAESTFAKTNGELEKIPAKLAALAQTSASLGAATAAKAPVVNTSDAKLDRLIELQTETKVLQVEANATLKVIASGQQTGNETLTLVAKNTGDTVVGLQGVNNSLIAMIESNKDVAAKITILQQTIVALSEDQQEDVNRLLGKIDSLLQEKGVNAETVEFANGMLSKMQQLVEKEAARQQPVAKAVPAKQTSYTTQTAAAAQPIQYYYNNNGRRCVRLMPWNWGR